MLADPSSCPQSPALTLLLEDEACWLRTLPQALAEAEANAEIYRKGWYPGASLMASGGGGHALPGAALKGKPACLGHCCHVPINASLRLDRRLPGHGGTAPQCGQDGPLGGHQGSRGARPGLPGLVGASRSTWGLCLVRGRKALAPMSLLCRPGVALREGGRLGPRHPWCPRPACPGLPSM